MDERQAALEILGGAIDSIMPDHRASGTLIEHATATAKALVERFGKKIDNQIDHPSHYGGADNPYEAIKVIDAWRLGFAVGNTVKYISRAGRKKGETLVNDLKKAAWYLAHEIGIRAGDVSTEMTAWRVGRDHALDMFDELLQNTPMDGEVWVALKNAIDKYEKDTGHPRGQNRDMAIALLTREVICEAIYQRRANWNEEHPNRALGIRTIDLTTIIKNVDEQRVTAMESASLRNFAATVLYLAKR